MDYLDKNTNNFYSKEGIKTTKDKINGKAYCDNCIWYEVGHRQASPAHECRHPNNIVTWNPYSPQESPYYWEDVRIKKSEWVKNYNNNCNDFERAI